MSKHKRGRVSSAIDPDFAAALEADDCKSGSADGRRDHKTRQLCRQAQRAINMALAEWGSAIELEQLYVDDVSPAPGCGHLLVHFVAPPGRPVPEVLASLRRAAPRLRAQVASMICRKHAPELSFVPAMRVGDSDV